MKKTFLTFLIISIFSICKAQVSKTVGDFYKITTFDQIEATLIPSDDNKIIINGYNQEQVQLINKNGELKIRMPIDKLLQGDAVSVTVFYTHLSALEANEGSIITSSKPITADNFDIIVKEGSQISIELQTDNLTARVANGSTLTLTGNTENQDIIVNSGGIYQAENFISKNTTITANAGGEADIYATNFVDAKVRAGGDITIYGKPKQINQKTIAGGTIKEAK